MDIQARRPGAAFAITAGLALAACGGHGNANGREARAAFRLEATDAPASPSPTASYPISPSGGTPATGPGDRYNSCERIWCLTHSENYSVEHFLAGHVGYILHTGKRGDVFVPRHRTAGPKFVDASSSAVLLCGRHAHPWLLAKGRGGPIHLTGYNHALGYSRAHFQSHGTRFEPCCVNGLGSAFVHSSAGKQFRFHETAEFRKNPSFGWQKPFAARVAPR